MKQKKLLSLFNDGHWTYPVTMKARKNLLLLSVFNDLEPHVKEVGKRAR